MRHRHPRTPSPEVQRHRQVRADYLRDLEKLRGLTEPAPPAPELPPGERCHCGAPLITMSYGRICGWGLHDG